jgi:hypothetical protein
VVLQEACLEVHEEVPKQEDHVPSQVDHVVVLVGSLSCSSSGPKKARMAKMVPRVLEQWPKHQLDKQGMEGSCLCSGCWEATTEILREPSRHWQQRLVSELWREREHCPVWHWHFLEWFSTGSAVRH